MKKVILIVSLLLVAIISVSGCINSDTDTSNKDYSVDFSNATELSTFTDAKALNRVKPSSSDMKLGFNVTDYGKKTINGIKVYYDVYTDSSDNSVNGDVYFEKNGKWSLIIWKDVSGNPNKALIDKEIADMIS
jgi:hypothetical protein